ncbi:hypothetical protein KSP40_PGU003716 [Platanthera guangdongensis]|uniref:Uncharacterized protein n=1 Tax=Platanthera guangdongensis TaxID=2320717 RepID=A0ABR2LUW1_9ASPA
MWRVKGIEGLHDPLSCPLRRRGSLESALTASSIQKQNKNKNRKKGMQYLFSAIVGCGRTPAATPPERPPWVLPLEVVTDISLGSDSLAGSGKPGWWSWDDSSSSSENSSAEMRDREGWSYEQGTNSYETTSCREMPVE